jgi:hypothetical protein
LAGLGRVLATGHMFRQTLGGFRQSLSDWAYVQADSWGEGICLGRVLPASFYRLGVCLGRLLPASFYRLGVCLGRLLPASFYRLGVCLGRLLPARHMFRQSLTG